MCLLLWSSHPTLISGVPVDTGAISCMIVCSWEKAVSFTPPGRHSCRTSSEPFLFPLLGVGHSAGFASFSIDFLLSWGKTVEMSKDLVSRWIDKVQKRKTRRRWKYISRSKIRIWTYRIYLFPATQSVIYGPVAVESQGCLLQMQNLRLHSGTTKFAFQQDTRWICMHSRVWDMLI